jgi:DNA-3-methyladenine glycosylase II
LAYYRAHVDIVMTELVQAVKLYAAEWSQARELWQTVDPRLHAAMPAEPVDRIIEVMPTPFGALVRAILHQQVSVAAGRAIVRRLLAAIGGDLDAARIVALTDDELRAAGLSRGKVRYIRALAEAEVAGTLARIEELPDEEIERALLALPGIGIWTVKMFLLFHLARPDVFAGGDLGLREGIRFLDGGTVPLTPAEAEARAERWRPYRSVASVVLWDYLHRTRQGLVTTADAALDGVPSGALNASSASGEPSARRRPRRLKAQPKPLASTGGEGEG